MDYLGPGVGNPMDEGTDEATLVFREQEDGRKVSRLVSGKVVLVDLDHVDEIADGERWLVRLDHRENYAIAHPLDQLPAPDPDDEEAEPMVQIRESRNGALGAADLPGVLRDPVDLDSLVAPGHRVAFFLDGPSLDNTMHEAGFALDHRRMRDALVGQGRFAGGTYYYAGNGEPDEGQVRFLDFLSHSGFTVRQRAPRRVRDGDRERVKTEVTPSLIVDALSDSDHFDVCFIGSGDGALEPLVEALQRRGKRVHVLTGWNSLSRELAYAADKPVVYVEAHREHFERAESPKKTA